jgi:hypothetical protein
MVDILVNKRICSQRTRPDIGDRQNIEVCQYGTQNKIRLREIDYSKEVNKPMEIIHAVLSFF